MVDKKKSLLEAIVEVKLGKTIFEANTSPKKDDEEEDLTPEQKAKEKASKATKTLTPEPGIVLDKSKYKGIDYKNQEKIPGDLMRRAWQPRYNAMKKDEAEKANQEPTSRGIAISTTKQELSPSASKPETKTPEPESKPEEKPSAPDLVVRGTPEKKKPETFSQAFARARKEAPATGQFQWTNPETGKTGTYQTNIKGKGTAEKPEEKYVPMSKQTVTSVKSNKEYEKKVEEQMTTENPLIEAFNKFRQKRIQEDTPYTTEFWKNRPKPTSAPEPRNKGGEPSEDPNLAAELKAKAKAETEKKITQSATQAGDVPSGEEMTNRVKSSTAPFSRRAAEMGNDNRTEPATKKSAPPPPPRPSSIPRPNAPTPPPKPAELKKEPEKSFAARNADAAIKRSEGMENRSGGN